MASPTPLLTPATPPALPELPLSRLSFLQSTAPDSLKPLITSLRQKHAAVAPSHSGPDPSEAQPHEINHLILANQIADLTGEDPHLTKGIMAEAANFEGLQDVARTFSHQQMAEMVAEGQKSDASAPGLVEKGAMTAESLPPAEKKVPSNVILVQRKLFHQHPSAVIARMADHGELQIEESASSSGTDARASESNANKELVSMEATPAVAAPKNPLRDGVVNFLDSNPAFNIREKSIVAHLAEQPHGLDPQVVKALKVVQTTQALTHTPEAIPVLSKAGFTSASTVVNVPEKTFVKTIGAAVGTDVAKAIHTHSTNITIRNNMALTSILQTTRGTGVAMIDGGVPKKELISKAIQIAAAQPERIDLEALFGPIDVCQCDDCNSVTSPAAYFVELLQFLRNDNLNPYSNQMAGPKPTPGTAVPPGWDPITADSGIQGIKGQTIIPPNTPLDVLLARRPDLANLELTCENTTTVLPYIDLANEVMESFVQNLASYSAKPDPRRSDIQVFNADPTTAEGLGGSTAELLAQPQNTNYQAYCILANAVFPSTKLPFNQPVEAIRLFLDFLGTNRADLGERFQGQYIPANVTLPSTSTTSSPGNPPATSYGTGKPTETTSANPAGDTTSSASAYKAPENSQKTAPAYSPGSVGYQQNSSPQKPAEGGYGQEGQSSYSTRTEKIASKESEKAIAPANRYGWDSDSSSCSSSSDDDSDDDCTPTGTGSTTSATGVPISAADQACLVQLHQQALARSSDAERLLLTEDEYIILTKEAFWAKKHFEIRHGTSIPDPTYRSNIGVRSDSEYWGVDYTKAMMLSQSEADMTGLTFVKRQFLPRTGIVYSDLVDLLRTGFINPYMPKGKDLVIMEAFRLSYKFMQTLLGPGKGKDRFIPVVEFLDSPKWHKTLKTTDATAPDVMTFFDTEEEGEEKGKKCKHHHPHHCVCKRRKRLLNWLCLHFDKMGKIIVLESLLYAHRLPWEGKLVTKVKPSEPAQIHLVIHPANEAADATPSGGVGPNDTFGSLGGPTFGTTGTAPPIPGVGSDETAIGWLKSDGTILDWKDGKDSTKIIGQLNINGSVDAIITASGGTTTQPWSDINPGTLLNNLNGEQIGSIDDTKGSDYSHLQMLVTVEEDQMVPWIVLRDDCDISNDRLRHLDGSSLTCEEYDKMHRFLRLWRKLGWTMIELDVALSVLGIPTASASACAPPAADPASNPTTAPPAVPVNTGADDVDWKDFISSCSNGKCGQQTCRTCSSPPTKPGGTYNNSPGGKPKKPKAKPKPLPSITPEFLHNLVALKNLADLTSLEILNLLALWGPISTAGTPSLYSLLFLTHNLLGVDQVFAADANGNYLVSTPIPKILDHVPVLLAAFRLKLKNFNELMDASIIVGGIGADLTLDSVSTIYRYVLLGRILGVTPKLIPMVFTALQLNAFTSAQMALDLVVLWNKISDAGFQFPQLNYVLTGTETDPLRQVAPTPRSLLQATMTLYTGLNDIENQHPLISDPALATSAVVLQNAQLLYASDVAALIVGFLDGTITIQTKAPSKLTITIPKEQLTLIAKLKYADGDQATLQITGQLTSDETMQTKALSADPGWSNAIDRCAKRAATFLKTTLSGVFPASADDTTKKTLLVGDIAPPVDPNAPNLDTSPGKRLYFLQYFIPFLKRKLADKLVIDTLSSSTSLDPLITGALLANVIFDTSDPLKMTSALDALEKIKDDPAQPSDGFGGYLIPTTTDTYNFIVEADNKPADMTLDGASISFSHNNPDDDPPDMWASDPIRLTGGRLYAVVLTGFKAGDLNWKTDRTQLIPVPPSSLLGNHVTTALTNLFVELDKCAIFINGFSLTLDEVTYFQANKDDFGKFDWNNLTLALWNRLADYATLKKSLPKLEPTLLDLFTWASNPSAQSADITKWLTSVTLWAETDLSALTSASHFNLLMPSDFRNEINLIKIQKALDVSTKIGMNVDLLFTWSQPRIDFWTLHDIAESIRVAIRARYQLSDWEVAIKPTYDTLRQLQSDALTAYLINQPALQSQPAFQDLDRILDADALFEFFLIDNQICPCMETSRMKQATSSVQLFIQRCFLDLENVYSITPDMLDRGRWDWMQRYRVWEANRKVFLYPENWIQPSLRDDKSPIYLQLESELMQKDLSTATVLEVMKNFLFKLDEVANLEVDAILVENPPAGSPKHNKIHIFARTRSAPYKFYYRYYDIDQEAWVPWQDMAVDIPRYEVEKPKKTVDPDAVTEPSLRMPGGFYIIPFVFNARLLIAIPQFTKVQLPAPVADEKLSQTGNNTNSSDLMPTEYWEIKMGVSELRNGKWTAKQLTSESIFENPHPDPLPPIGQYRFVSRNVTDPSKPPVVLIDCYRLNPPAPAQSPISFPGVGVTPLSVGRFRFTGLQLGNKKTEDAALAPLTQVPWTDFQFEFKTDTNPPGTPNQYRIMFPLQGNGENADLVHHDDTFVKYTAVDESDRQSAIVYDKTRKPDQEFFYHNFVDDMLDEIGRTDNLDDLFDYLAPPPNTPQPPTWKKHLDINKDDIKYNAYGAKQLAPGVFNELDRPYALYNWELGFHAPMAIVDRLLQKQQFDAALKMIQYVFDPLASGSEPLLQRVWKWLPFRETDPKKVLENIFDSLRPNTADSPTGQINQWRDNAFQPHVVARDRPTAYMKYVVMKYISILIAYGDWYFNQNTLEFIPMAIQCYVLASHIYGPAGQQIPKRGKKKVQTYNTLLNQWDAFSNAMVQMEVLFPFSINQISTSTGVTNGAVGLANIFGFASTSYFCIPDNPDLRAVRATIDDRLFKIRHCQDINGVVRILPLYEPPIDPGLLVAAAAAGLSLSSVLNDLNSPLPNYKFKNLLRKALGMCKHLKALGAAFVLAKERKDTEALMELKQRHDGVVKAMVVDQKKLAADESQKAVEHLQQSRKLPEYQMTHNIKLLGEDLGSIPSIGDVESEFKELADQIEAPAVESGLKLIASEKDEIEKAVQSLDWKPIINIIETAASELHVLPILNAHASPLGCGVAACWGPPNIAKGIQGVSKAYNMVSDWLAHQSSNVSRVQNFVKQNQSRVKEANSTGYEIKKIDKQIVTHQVRVAVNQADVAQQQQATDNAQEVHDFLTSKYTNTELYTWAEQQVSDLYYNTYTATYELARKAEMAFRYERGLPDASDPPPFIQFGYWQPSNDGLLSGERIFLSLKDLESAYHETRGHDFEITKHVSLRSINPLALLALRSDAIADFAVPEILFDMDFPGHFGRRLKSVALTMRSSTQPTESYYANVNCTLRLTSHKFRNTSIVANDGDYPEKTDQDDLRFSSTSHVPISSIATSSPSNDAGVFEINFDGERFLPFEGAGAISMWRLELNDSFRTFDYDAIEDVVLHLSYTSLDGGNKLGGAAKKAVTTYIKDIAQLSEHDGLYAVFDGPHDFPTEFAAAKAGPDRTMTLTALNTKLPIYTKGYAADKLQTQDVYIVTDVALAPGDVNITQGSTVMSFGTATGAAGKSSNAIRSTDGPAAMKDWVVALGNGVAGVSEMWILVRYSMT